MRSTRAEKYPQEAARLQYEAEWTKHPDIRRQLLNIATQYDDLANSLSACSLWSGLSRSAEKYGRDHANAIKIGIIRRMV